MHLYVPDIPWRVGCSGSGSLSRCQHGLRSVIILISVTCRMTDAQWVLIGCSLITQWCSVSNQWATLMHSAHLRLYLEGISPYRVVYTVIVSSLIALLQPLFSGVLYLIKKIHYDEVYSASVTTASDRSSSCWSYCNKSGLITNRNQVYEQYIVNHRLYFLYRSNLT